MKLQIDEIADFEFYREGLDKLEIKHLITQPEIFPRLVLYIIRNNICKLNFEKLSPNCYDAMIDLMNQCKQLRELSINFCENVGITLPMVVAIKNHPALVDLKISGIYHEDMIVEFWQIFTSTNIVKIALPNVRLSELLCTKIKNVIKGYHNFCEIKLHDDGCQIFTRDESKCRAIALAPKLVVMARNKYLCFDLVGAMEDVDLYCSLRHDGICNTIYSNMREMIDLLVHFDDPATRREKMYSLWYRRKESPEVKDFFVSLFYRLDIDLSQLPFLNHPYEKYLFIMMLAMGRTSLETLTFNRQAFYNAVHCVLDPAGIHDVMIRPRENETLDDFSFDRCVFHCNLVRYLKQTANVLIKAGLVKEAAEFLTDLKGYLCDDSDAVKLLAKLLSAPILPFLQQCDEYEARTLRLMQAYADGDRKNNLFKSVSENILIGFQSWLEDPYRFSAAKREQQQISLLQQQVKLLSASGLVAQQRALPVIAKEDIATATTPGFFGGNK